MIGTDAWTRGSVLVVEDDPSLRELYLELLHEDRWEAHAASDGLEALSLLDAGLSPCVVLIDLRMPRMDGWQLAPHLRERKLPFVVLAAHYQIEQEARRVGARWWLQKPVAMERLLDTVATACAAERVA